MMMRRTMAMMLIMMMMMTMMMMMIGRMEMKTCANLSDFHCIRPFLCLADDLPSAVSLLTDKCKCKCNTHEIAVNLIAFIFHPTMNPFSLSAVVCSGMILPFWPFLAFPRGAGSRLSVCSPCLLLAHWSGLLGVAPALWLPAQNIVKGFIYFILGHCLCRWNRTSSILKEIDLAVVDLLSPSRLLKVIPWKHSLEGSWGCSQLGKEKCFVSWMFNGNDIKYEATDWKWTYETFELWYLSQPRQALCSSQLAHPPNWSMWTFGSTLRSSSSSHCSSWWMPWWGHLELRWLLASFSGRLK